MTNRNRVIATLSCLLSTTACLRSGGNASEDVGDTRESRSDAGKSQRDGGGPTSGEPARPDADVRKPSTRNDSGPTNEDPTPNPDEPMPTRGNGGSSAIPNGAGGGVPSTTSNAGAGGTSPAQPTAGSGGASAGAPNEPTGAGGAPSSGSCAPNDRRCAGEQPELCDADGVWRPLLACEAPQHCVAGECKQPIENACPLIPTLPRFQGGTQVVDGEGSEFSGIAPVTFALNDAPIVSASYSTELPTIVSVRMAWSDEAFVAHVHVEDPAIHTYEGSTLEYFWRGDNVQFFIAPTDALTGEYSGTEDGGATHLVIVPPSGTRAAQAIEVYEPCYACVDASPSAANYAARVVPGGYEIELSWNWSAPQGSFSPGDRVALNLIVGTQDDPDAGLQLEGLLANNPVGTDTPCGNATHPGCDDRTWCFSVLE